MAELAILLQGLLENDDHETAVRNLLLLPAIDCFLFSIAFARRSGVELLKDNLEKSSEKIRVFIGIRNGITSVQSIFSFLEVGIQPYVVDTASNYKIFHPKIYAAYNNEMAHVILGSANLTHGGFNQNIEVSSHIKLDLTQDCDAKYLHKLVKTIQELPATYPNHIFQVKNVREAVELLREGRLEDERLIKLPPITKVKKRRGRDDLSPIPTYSKNNLVPRKGVKKQVAKINANSAILMWQSKPLTERSLNIPSATNTNITGDTNLGQGLMEDIDFQHYFRDVVFSDLTWSTEPQSKSPQLERATISAEIIIKNISYGVRNLAITHDPRTGTASYRQRNAMTKIRWGKTRPLIAKRDLLGRSMKLYRKGSKGFLLVVD